MEGVAKNIVSLHGKFGASHNRLIRAAFRRKNGPKSALVCRTRGTNTDNIRDVVCANGNPKTLLYGDPLATMGGQSDTTFDDIFDCWLGHTTTKWFDDDGNEIEPTYDEEGNLVEPSGQGITEHATSFWSMTLPVIDCPSKDANVGPCNAIVGAVNINVAWIVHPANDIDADAPREMQYSDVDEDSGEIVEMTWTAPEPPEACVKNRDKEGNVSAWWKDCRGEARWDAFVTQFNIRSPDNQLATIANGGWNQKTIYFLPDCRPHRPTGRTGGENFGVMSRIPVLVD